MTNRLDLTLTVPSNIKLNIETVAGPSQPKPVQVSTQTTSTISKHESHETTYEEGNLVSLFFSITFLSGYFDLCSYKEGDSSWKKVGACFAMLPILPIIGVLTLLEKMGYKASVRGPE